MPRSSETPALRFGDGPAVRPYQVLTRPPMNRETPTLQSERGLSQTAARMLARALNQPDAWPGGAPVSDPARFGSWSQCMPKKKEGSHEPGNADGAVGARLATTGSSLFSME
jgi:hypothetical protein